MQHARREVIWSLTAQQDLIDIWAYFAHVASPTTADRLIDEIEAAANRLVIDPRMHRVRHDLIPDLPGDLRAAPAHPYTLFYRTDPRSADGQEQMKSYASPMNGGIFRQSCRTPAKSIAGTDGG